MAKIKTTDNIQSVNEVVENFNSLTLWERIYICTRFLKLCLAIVTKAEYIPSDTEIIL